MRWILAAVIGLGLGAGLCGQDYAAMLKGAKVTLAEAADKALKDATSGVVVLAELEEEDGQLIWSISVARGAEVLEVAVDAKDGKILEQDTESEDCSAAAKAAKITLSQATATALGKVPGAAVRGEIAVRGEKPEARIRIFAGGKATDVVVDAVTGAVVPAGTPSAREGATGGHEAEAAGPQFTDVFGEEDRDLGPTGTNPFFILEPGYQLVLQGTEAGQNAEITITVLDETKKIAGVETRVVEEREVIGGQVKEVTRDYCAISRRTNNVYYFGEDVDEYRDGKVTGHPGSWLAGEKGCRYGLLMPAAPLLGARYWQEIAPGVALDRAEVASIADAFECPAGRFTGVLRTIESSALEKGTEAKRYARGIGLLQDGDLKLVKYGKAPK